MSEVRGLGRLWDVNLSLPRGRGQDDDMMCEAGATDDDQSAVKSVCTKLNGTQSSHRPASDRGISCDHRFGFCWKSSMKELIRDTVFGHFLRIVTKIKVLSYEEERDPSLWKQFLDKEKSGNLARHGSVNEPQKDEEKEGQAGGDESSDNQGFKDDEVPNGEEQRQPQRETNPESRRSSDTRVGEQERRNEASGVVIDPEKGRDVSLITWFGDDDPEVCSLTVT